MLEKMVSSRFSESSRMSLCEGFIKKDVLIVNWISRDIIFFIIKISQYILQVLSLNESTSTQKLVEKYLSKYVRKKEKNKTLFNTGTLAIVTDYYFTFLSESTETKAGWRKR